MFNGASRFFFGGMKNITIFAYSFLIRTNYFLTFRGALECSSFCFTTFRKKKLKKSVEKFCG